MTSRTSFTAKYVCSASSNVIAAGPVLRTVSDIPSELPSVTRYVASKGCGHAETRVLSLSPSVKVSAIASSVSCASVSVQALMRAKPCMGACLSVACGPNHGKQTGTPPRIGLAGSKALSRLRKITGARPRGCHAARCAPCRYTSAVPWRSLDMRRQGRAPLPLSRRTEAGSVAAMR